MTRGPYQIFATTRNAASVLNLFTSRSRSTTKRTATDCTRPAESDGFTFFHNTGDSSKPTKRSKNAAGLLCVYQIVINGTRVIYCP